MRTLIVDRFEGNFAICEEEGVEKLFGIDRSELPANVREGDLLEIDGEGNLSINEEKTRQRREKILARQKKMFQK